jgi:hypothetical protein
MYYITSIIKNIKSIRTLNKFLQKDVPKPIGRWKIEQCNKKVNHKIDLSNEDHCGPCGEYALGMRNQKEKTKK